VDRLDAYVQDRAIPNLRTSKLHGIREEKGTNVSESTQTEYPSWGKFQLKSSQVDARQFDGSDVGAHAMLVWVLENGGAGVYKFAEDMNTYLLWVGHSPEQLVNKLDWVVRTESGKFNVFSNAAFHNNYEPKPLPMPTGGAGGVGRVYAGDGYVTNLGGAGGAGRNG
jgi:hypothetical protein